MVGSTILVEDRGPLVSLYSLNLNLYLGTEVKHIKNHIEVLDFLKTNPEINLIITKSNINKDDTALSISKFLSERNLKIPLIILGQESKVANGAKVLALVPELKTLVKTAADLLGITAQKMAAMEVPEHFPIPTSHIKPVDELICDIFQKKIDETGEYFIKSFNQGKKLSSEEINKLEKSGEKYVYVPSRHRLKFADSVTEKMLETLRNQNLTTEVRVQATDESLQLVSEQMRHTGIQENTILLAQESIKSISQLANQSSDLSELIKNLMSDKVSFRYKHCQILTFICFHILENLDWGTKEQQDKLAFVSFFHDLALNTDEEVRIHSDEELNESKLSAHQKEIVKKHATLAASLVKDFPSLPLGAEIIILQHHGSRTGVGFSSLASSISPLAQVFIIAEDWTHIALNAQEEGRKISTPKLLKYLREKTGNKQNYAKIIDTLEMIKI